MKRVWTCCLLSVFLGLHVGGRGATPVVRITPHRLPVLAGRADNPALTVELIPRAGASCTLRGIVVELRAKNGLEDIRCVRVFRSSGDGTSPSAEPWGQDMAPASTMTFADEHVCLAGDTLRLQVCLEMKDRVDLRNRFTVTCSGIVTSEARLAIDAEAMPALRPGVVVRDKGDDGVHTYRIPGLATTNRGVLLAIYDVRHDSGRDLQGDIDIGLSRSVDGGVSWEPMRIILDRGSWGGLPERYNGVSDANILVDRTTGECLVTALWMHGVLDKEGKWVEGLDDRSDRWEHQWRDRGSQPGYDPRRSAQVLQVRSSDEGLTWSSPVNITRMGKRRAWWLWAPSPGNGITLDDGTLVMPTQGRDAEGTAFSNLAWSDDHGRSWHSSAPAFTRTSESTVAQLSDGSLMLNMRLAANRQKWVGNGRAICVTRDRGRTWEEHPSSRGALIEPVCMGSLYRHVYDGGRKSVLLFSNPDSKIARVDLGIKASFDDGMTWPESHRVLLDEGRSAGYSCLSGVDERTIGILYESSRAQLVFQWVELDELIEPQR